MQDLAEGLWQAGEATNSIQDFVHEGAIAFWINDGKRAERCQ